ncbi:MAG: hypothetical protein LBQ03_02440 [Puniceicoccales bacterium]|jgi:serine/threonine protein kinase|nr:hypothetical protein [Puniceicoccales bacterium]
MNKKRLSCTRKKSCYLIAFGLLFSNLNANENGESLVLDLTCGLLGKLRSELSSPLLSPSEKEAMGKKQQFAIDFLGASEINKGTKITKGEKLGEGGFGIVYAGDADGQNLIVKQELEKEPNTPINAEFIAEFTNADALLNSLIAKLKEKDPKYATLLGMGAIIPAIGMTKDGSLVQKRVSGLDLKKITLDCNSENRTIFHPPYDLSGYPNNCQEAIGRAISFYYGLQTIHGLDRVHCDIKPANVMVANDAFANYPSLIIDLGAMTEIGEEINMYSDNGAPEVIEKMRLISKNSSEIKKLEDDYDELLREYNLLYPKPKWYEKVWGLIRRKKPNSANFETQQKCRNKLHELLEQKNALRAKTQTMMFELPPADPSYDIYSSASVLPPILFGAAGYRWANSLYFPDEESDPSQYVQDAQNPDFNAEKYFMESFSKLNRVMQKVTGQSYPQPILKRFADLQARISDPNPRKRPSAADVIQVLQGLMFAPYWETVGQPNAPKRKKYFLDIK